MLKALDFGISKAFDFGISKEELIFRVRGANCKMLVKLNLEKMTRDQILEHLRTSCCPVLKKLESIRFLPLE